MKKIISLTFIILLVTFVFNNCKTSPEIEENESTVIKGETVQNDDTQGNKMGTFKLSICADNGSNSAQTLSVQTMIISPLKKEVVTSLVVTIESLEVHRTSDSNAGWHTIPITDGTFDLIALDASSWAEIISNTTITPGNYNQIRFKVTGAKVTTASGTYDAKIPSNKIKLNVPFKVNEDGTTEITIEVNPKASLIIAGNKNNPKYILKPVLHVKKVDEDD